MAKRKKPGRTPVAAPTQRAARDRRPLLFATAGAAVLAIIAIIGIGVLVLSGGGSDTTNDSLKRAVIVDQLQLTQPNPEFISNARETLGKAGYSVDYIPGDDVTVNTYRGLASHNYDLVILRVHAGLTNEKDAETGEISKEAYVSLFTNEKYEENKYADQLNNLGVARYADGSGRFFGIGPLLIKSIPGNFNGATVILMGCDGLKSQRTGQAFLDKGASSFVSWSDQVSGAHTDQATDKLLKHMLLEGIPVEQAVQMTSTEVGPDPSFAGELRILTG